MRLYDQQSGDDLRFALNNPDLLSPADIAKRDSMAERFNTSYGMADAGFDDLSQEARIADARKVQADVWVKEAPENAAFLAEDGDKLMAVYDSLVDNGLLDEQDMPRNFAQDVADSSSGWGDTIEIARLNAEVVELGQSFLNGTQGDMETFRAKVADVYGKLNAYRARRSDPTGFYGFVEQMYRMGTEDVPHVLLRGAESALTGASAGAVGGAILGSAVPVAGNLTGAVGGAVAGGLAGLQAGVTRGMYEAGQRGEEANFAVQMLMQKDDAGNFLDENTVREMARLYGMGSAAIETASDLVTAKILSPVLKTVGAKLGGLPAKMVAKDAMKSAIQHQSIKPVLLGVAKSMGAGALAEGAEEASQEGLSSQVEAWAKNWLNDQGKNYFHDVEQGLLGSEAWGDMARAGFEGAKVGLWFHVLPGVTKLYLDSQDVARARSFADKHKAVAQKVAESETAQLSPSRMETFLQSKGLNQTVLIPADAAWQMQQEGVDIVGAFGWRSETLEEAAAMGQDVAVSAARLHARFHAQPEVMNTLCNIMREKPNSMNVLEAMDDGILADDVDAINEAMEEWQFSQNMIDSEMERLRSILKPAVLSIPELRRQILGVVDADTSVSSYIDAILAQIAGNAQYIAAHGGDGAGYISGLKIQGLVDALEGYGVGKVSPEERMAQEEMAAQAEADRPFWDNVWGMLDADSLKRDFPEARQELAKLHGRGLFAKKGEGIAVDELADMLKNAGWLEQDADSSTLVEMLKSKKRPKGKKVGPAGVEPNVMFQPINDDVDLDYRVPVVSIVPRFDGQNAKVLRKSFPKEFREEVLEAFADGVVNPDLEAKQIGKEGAYGKLMMSSADFKEHLKFSDKDAIDGLIQLEAIAALPDLVRNARLVESYDDKKNVRQIKKMHRLQAALRIGSKDYSVKITVKEYNDGELSIDYDTPLKVYHHRVEKEMPAGNSYEGPERGVHKPSAGIDEYTLRELLRDVNDSAGVPFDVLEQRAWHGTPHNFDAFTLQAIGSGEGAQAHGWGLYFAKNKTTAKRYKTGLSKGKGGRLFEVDIPENNVLLDEQKAFAAQHKNVQKLVLEAIQTMSETEQDVFYKRILGSKLDDSEAYNKATSKLDRERLFLKALTGVADSKIVRVWHRRTLLERGYSEAQIDELWGDAAKAKAEIQKFLPEVQRLEAEQKALKQRDDERRASLLSEAKSNPEATLAKVYGEQIYDAIAWAVSKESHPDFRAASEALNSVGIKGITYEGGRDGRCFVVFDDKAIQILDKLYQEQSSYAAGSTTPLEEGYFIQLFKGANLSTLSHELTHAMYLEMERLEREGLADERMLEDLATIRNWTAHMDDDANLKAEYDKRIRPRSDFGMEFDQLTPEMKAIARAIAKQEMVARGFEQYLREGNAPTPKLEGVFRRFAKWLERVYKTALMLDVELNDEVRDVFDRWMASDEDIQAAAVNANIRDESGTVLDSLGVQGADRLELEHLIHEAKEKASDALRRDRAAKMRESVKAWREEAEAEVAADPVYAAREAMRREPLDLDAIVDAYGQDAAAKLMKKVPASLKKGGANPEALAFDFGFRNAGEMLKAIEAKPGKRERIQEIVKQKREDADAQFSAEDYLFEQDALADQQEKIGEILYRLELEGKTQGGKPVQPEQQDYEDFKSHARALRAVGREQIKTVAEKHLDELEVAKAIRPDLFRAAAARLMREERAAILAKDWRAAMEANYKARLNIELARQAAQRRDIMENLTSKAKRFLKSKETDVNARFAIFVLSQNIQLFPATMKMLADAGDKGIDNVRTFLNEMKEAGYYTIDAEIDESLFTGGAAAWRAMRWGKGLQPYVDAMTTIMHMERESRKANSEAAKQSWNEQMDALEASIRSFYPNAPTSPSAQHESGLLHWLKKFHAEHLKADTVALILDGDRSFGPAWEAIVRPINQATWKKVERMREESRRLKELFGAYSHNELMHMKGDRIFIDAIGEPLTKEQMIACALNCGNEENMQRLMDGFNWNRDQLQAVLDMLDERDWRFVQGVWDYLESFRKESFDLEEKLSGIRPKAIEAKPLQTKYGTLRGGYYPAVYDPRKTSRAIDPESVGTQTSGTNAVVDHGSMKQRTATGLKAPLKLDLGVIPSHVEKTVHMLAFREPVRSVGRVLNDRRVNNAIQSALGVEVANALGDWLKYVAGERPARSSIGDVAGWMRKNSALFTMGFKLSTMLMQVTGYLTTIAELGPKWSSIGVMKVYGSGSPLAAYNMAMELSPMMRTRMQSIDRDVFEASTKLLEEGSRYPVADQLLRFRAEAEKYAFKGMGVVQMFAADLPTWHGAFAKGMEEWNDKQKAAEFADMVVERTQVGGADKDLAGMQTGGKYGELGKLATQFYSYFSALYQLFTRRTNALKRSEWKGPAEWWRLGTLALLTWCVEPALQSLMPNSGPDDDEEWLRWWGREVAFQPFNMVIGVRDVANMYKSRMEGYSGSFRPSPSLDTFNAIGRFSDQIVNLFQGEGDTKKLALSGGKALGLTTGLVNAQELLILEEFWDWLDGTNPDFELADLIRRKKK